MVLTKAQMNEVVTITCYRQTKQMLRKIAIALYKDYVRHSEGSERDRYINILFALEEGKTECVDIEY